MYTSLRIGNLLVAAVLACGLVACTSSDSSTGGTGGSAPTGTGGNTGAGGSTAPTGLGTLCPQPAQVITDFTMVVDAGTASGKLRFGASGFLSGGGSYFPETGDHAINQDLSQGNWHLSGTVSDYSGMSLYFDNCDRVDASKFKGISFTISGSVANGNAITMSVGTVGTTANPTWMLANGKATAKPTDAGRCVPTSNSNNQYYAPGCIAPLVSIPVKATPTQVTVTWADLRGGTPEASPNPAEITSIAWALPWSENGTPYAMDIVMDDLAFIP